MKSPILFLSVFLGTIGAVSAQDIRNKVAKIQDGKEPNLLIVPNKSIFGIALGTPQEAVFKKLGKPKAFVVLASSATAAIYQNSIAYLFKDDKLSGVYLNHGIIDSNLVGAFHTEQETYRNIGWKLPNGIRENLSLAKIRKILGDKLEDDPTPYQKSYLDGDQVIHLYFSHYVDRGDDDSAYTLHRILIKPKKASTPAK
ncbi:MAG: hypothetical protein ACJAQT_001412 [Akkermansiaceae bacterium]|jgi:hypothetical protein